MSSHKKAAARGMDKIVEHAHELMEATTDVAGKKVSEALASGKKIYGQARDHAVSRVRASDKFIRRNPYAALGMGVGVGILIAFLMRSRDGD